MRKFSWLAYAFGLSVAAAACGGTDMATTERSTEGLVLGVRCGQDSDCPAGFQCETEWEHGRSSSQCLRHNGGGNGGKRDRKDGGSASSNGETPTQSTVCPAGYELETEHGTTTCKAHRSGDAGQRNGRDAGSASATSKTETGDDRAEAGLRSADSESSAISCYTDADCGAGLECETEVEHGVTVSRCKPHGGNSR